MLSERKVTEIFWMADGFSFFYSGNNGKMRTATSLEPESGGHSPLCPRAMVAKHPLRPNNGRKAERQQWEDERRFLMAPGCLLQVVGFPCLFGWLGSEMFQKWCEKVADVSNPTSLACSLRHPF
jgi:hypothetical protein